MVYVYGYYLLKKRRKTNLSKPKKQYSLLIRHRKRNKKECRSIEISINYLQKASLG